MTTPTQDRLSPMPWEASRNGTFIADCGAALCLHLAMSMEMYVVLGGSAMPSVDTLQAELDRLGFPIVLDTSLDLASASGFQPVQFRDEATGFEVSHVPSHLLEQPPDLGVTGEANCMAFAWGGDLSEMAAAIATASALVGLVDGVLYDPQDEVSYGPSDALAMAIDVINSV